MSVKIPRLNISINWIQVGISYLDPERYPFGAVKHLHELVEEYDMTDEELRFAIAELKARRLERPTAPLTTYKSTSSHKKPRRSRDEITQERFLTYLAQEDKDDTTNNERKEVNTHGSD